MHKRFALSSFFQTFKTVKQIKNLVKVKRLVSNKIKTQSRQLSN